MRMRTALLLVFITGIVPLGQAVVSAQEQIVNFERESVPVLNEELRKLRKRTGGGTECVTAPCDLHEDTTLNETEICLEDGTNCGTGIPGGSDTMVQYNCSGAFCGDAGFTYAAGTDSVDISGGLRVDTDTLNVDYSGNKVGVGTQFPQARLELRNAGTSDALRVYNDTTLAAIILSTGSVGINDETPREKLEVNGNIQLPRSSSTTGKIQFDNNGFHGFMYYDSAKDNIGIVDSNVDFTKWAGGDICIGGNTCWSFDGTQSNITVMGDGSGARITSASNATAYGSNVLSLLTSGYDNAAFGANSSSRLTTGHENTAVGTNSGARISTGNLNTLVGAYTGYSNTTTKGLTTGTWNTIIGARAGQSGTAGGITGGGNVIIGSLTAGALSTGTLNVIIGHQAGDKVTTGNNNVFIGPSSGNSIFSNITGGGNTMVGDSTGTALSSGAQNVVIGQSAGTSLTTGGENVFMGHLAGSRATAGTENIFIGFSAGGLSGVNAESYNIGIGSHSLAVNTNGRFNTGLGYFALSDNTTGDQNIALGSGALSQNTTGDNNIAIGDGAMENIDAGASDNIAIGVAALNDLSFAGINNVAIGSDSGLSITTGGNNVSLGYGSNSVNTTGSSNTFIGYETDPVGTGLSNATAIGANAKVSSSNTMVLGSGVGVVIGRSTVETSAILEMSSVTKALLVPRISDVAGGIASPKHGMIAYDSTDDQIQGYVSNEWRNMTPRIITASSTLNFGSTAVNASTDLTMPLTGAATIDTVSLGVSPDVFTSGTNMTNGFFTGWVASADTVNIRFTNNDSALTADPASGTFKATIIK